MNEPTQTEAQKRLYPEAPPVPLAYFDPGGGRRIAYRQRQPKEGQKGPTLLFLPGYASDMEGSKAIEIDAFAAAAGLGCVRMDYSGTGASGGEFADGTLDRWLEEVLAAIDLLTEGNVVVIGSSMGGWLAIHAALRRKDRVAGVLGIAAAPDFTDWGFTTEQKEEIIEKGKLEEPNPYGDEPYVTHKPFLVSGGDFRLLHGPIEIDCPVRLVHGDKDEDVPIGVAFKLLEDLHSGDVQLTIVKWGEHRMSEPHQIQTIIRALVDVCEAAIR